MPVDLRARGGVSSLGPVRSPSEYPRRAPRRYRETAPNTPSSERFLSIVGGPSIFVCPRNIHVAPPRRCLDPSPIAVGPHHPARRRAATTPAATSADSTATRALSATPPKRSATCSAVPPTAPETSGTPRRKTPAIVLSVLPLHCCPLADERVDLRFASRACADARGVRVAWSSGSPFLAAPRTAIQRTEQSLAALRARRGSNPSTSLRPWRSSPPPARLRATNWERSSARAASAPSTARRGGTTASAARRSASTAATPRRPRAAATRRRCSGASGRTPTSARCWNTPRRRRICGSSPSSAGRRWGRSAGSASRARRRPDVGAVTNIVPRSRGRPRVRAAVPRARPSPRMGGRPRACAAVPSCAAVPRPDGSREPGPYVSDAASLARSTRGVAATRLRGISTRRSPAQTCAAVPRPDGPPRPRKRNAPRRLVTAQADARRRGADVPRGRAEVSWCPRLLRGTAILSTAGGILSAAGGILSKGRRTAGGILSTPPRPPRG